MPSFVIRRSDVKDDEFPDFNLLNSRQYAEVLRPASYLSQPIEGWGNHRIAVESCEVSFSEEMVGLQVDFEGGIEEQVARRILEEIAASITCATGQPAEVEQIE